jgi:hypothetical protein
MNQHQDQQINVLETLRRRCSALGLDSWMHDETGRHMPAAAEAAYAPQIKRAAALALTRPAHTDPAPVLIAPEDWAVPLVGPCGRVLVVRSGAGLSPARLGLFLRELADDLTHQTRDKALLQDFSGKLIQSYEETYTLFRIMRFMASSAEPSQQMHMVCGNVQQILPFGWVCVIFRNDPRVIDDLRGSSVIAGTCPVPASQRERLFSQIAETANHDGWTKVHSADSCELARACGSEIVCDPITYDGAVIGMLLAGNKGGPDPEVASPEMQFIDAVADFLGTFHENLARFSDQRAMSIGTLHALTAAIDAKDAYTRGHSQRVAFLSQAIATAMGMGPDHAERVRIAGLVHDVGKIGVPEAILCKTGKLTDDEFAMIRKHPEIGHRILKGIVLLEDTLPGVLHHHERWDGRGYPAGISGEEIPLIARMIGLADTFDAMSSSRSYRPAMPRERVLAEIQRCSGTQFDPTVVAAFWHVDLSQYDALLERQLQAEQAGVRHAA